MSSSRNTPHTDKSTGNYPSKLWWFFAVAILTLCLLVQLPMFWIVQKFIPDSPYIQWVSGSLWQGSATWHTPVTHNNNSSNSITQNNTTSLNGTLTWQWQPLKIFIGKISAHVVLTSGKSRLKGQLSTGLTGTYGRIQEWSGRITPETLSAVLEGWQLPDAPIQVNKLSGSFAKEVGFNDVEGQLTWVGGQLGYPNAGKILPINMPAMKANTVNEQNILKIYLVDEDDKKLGDFQVTPAGMLDVNLTQRLLENMPTYSGSAPKDSPVVSIRQPLTSLGDQ